MCVVTVLIDNAAAPGLASEHGLALWIEAHGIRLLFDTGQSAACLENARALGVPVEAADALVLSHGHYDHTGSVACLLAMMPALQVYAHPSVVQARFSVRNHAAKNVRMPDEARAALAALPPEHMHTVRTPCMLTDGIGLSGPIPRCTGYEDTGGPFFLDADGTQPDLIEDDQALWIHTPGGLIICCGCCHAGLINTLQYVCRLAGDARIAALIGGLHLLHANNERLAATLAALRTYDPARIIPCHCTGEAAVHELQAAFPGRVTPGYAGLRHAANGKQSN